MISCASMPKRLPLAGLYKATEVIALTLAELMGG
jgi:hypothetical protein